MAVVIGQVLTKPAQVEALVDTSQKMVWRNEAFQVERIKQSILISALLTHHHGTINYYAIRIFYQAAFPMKGFSTENSDCGQ